MLHLNLRQNGAKCNILVYINAIKLTYMNLSLNIFVSLHEHLKRNNISIAF